MLSPTIKAVTLLVCCSLAFGAVAQTADTVRASVEKAVWGVQPGFLGIWAYNELRLTDPIALRMELGLSGQLYVRGGDDVALNLTWTPVIGVEPRWYYNLGKRKHYSKNITGNNGNFISLSVSYRFGQFFPNSFKKGIRQIDAIPIVFSWGIRRNITRCFTFEVGVGLGIQILAKSVIVFKDLPGSDLISTSVLSCYKLHFRIGYRFLGNAPNKKNK